MMGNAFIISSFRGEYEFLSNFFHWPFEMDGFVWKTAEHAFQCAKTHVPTEQSAIRTALQPSQAKYLGRHCTLRPDWDEVKLEIMEKVLRHKFAQPALRSWLLRTGEATLVEGNSWGDTYWGKCRGIGENHLGKLLMKLREEFKEDGND